MKFKTIGITEDLDIEEDINIIIMKLGKIFGIEHEVSPWIIFAPLFFMRFDGLTLDTFKMDMAIVLMVYLSVLFHEYGHVLAGYLNGMKTKKVILHIMGGGAELEDMDELNKRPWAHIGVAIAGPIVNFIIAFGAVILGILNDGIPQQEEFSLYENIYAVTFFMNMILGVTNLFPIFSLDGGRITKAILQLTLPNTEYDPEPWKPMRKAFNNELIARKIAAKISIVTCGILIFLCLSISSIFLALFCAFFGFISWNELKAVNKVINVNK